MQTNNLINIPTVGKNESMINDPFYKWLSDNNVDLSSNFFDQFDLYAANFGFIKGENIISEENLKNLEYVYKYYCDLWIPERTPQKLSDLFSDTIPNEKIGNYDNQNEIVLGGFWVRELDGKKTIQPKLLSIIEKHCGIYALNCFNYYFEVINGFLFLKYQSIIGSRRLCKVVEND